MSKILGNIQSGLGRSGFGLLQGGGSGANYTMEELLKRVRRIERLTDRMAQGNFESNKPNGDAQKKAAQMAVMSMIGSVASGSIHDATLERRKSRRL